MRLELAGTGLALLILALAALWPELAGAAEPQGGGILDMTTRDWLTVISGNVSAVTIPGAVAAIGVAIARQIPEVCKSANRLITLGEGCLRWVREEDGAIPIRVQLARDDRVADRGHDPERRRRREDDGAREGSDGGDEDAPTRRLDDEVLDAPRRGGSRPPRGPW